jgi:uncharacterized protein (TIGR00266 family)
MQANIKGTTMPVLEFLLNPGESIISPHGELSWMSPNIQMSQTMNSGGGGGFMKGLKRVVGGGGLFMTRYDATGGGTAMLAFAAKMPGHIVPVAISPENPMIVHRSGWIASTPGVNQSVAFQKTFTRSLFGGEGFILQRLDGQGTAWIDLSGELTEFTLAPGQQLLVHPGHVGMFESTVSFTMTTVPGIKNKVFGGDGFFLVVLSGPGKIWLQSLPIPNLAHSLEPYLPRESGGGDGRGSDSGLGGIVGGLLRG